MRTADQRLIVWCADADCYNVLNIKHSDLISFACLEVDDSDFFYLCVYFSLATGQLSTNVGLS